MQPSVATEAAPTKARAFGPYTLEPQERRLWREGKLLRIGSRAFDILVVLVERAGQFVTPEELVSRVWPDSVVAESNLRVHIAALRKLLREGQEGQEGGQSYILNVALRGYTFVMPSAVSAASAPAAAAAATGSHLPARSAKLIGRDAQIDEIATRLPQRGLLSLIGPGGIGKTSLAIAVATKLEAGYRHGARFVDFAPLARAALAAVTVASVLGISVRNDDAMSGLVAFLRDKHMLLVLDNCEHLVDGVAVLCETLRHAAPNVHLLVTSRELLRVAGESVHRLAPLGLPAADAAQPATTAQAIAYPAVQLLVERCTASHSSFALRDADVPAALALCHKLDGVPLAIEIAAARVEHFGLRGLVEALDAHFIMAAAGRRTALPRQKTLQATLDWSYDLLAPQEQAAFRALAVFLGPFTVESAMAVVGASLPSPQLVLDSIYSLVNKSLLTADIGLTPVQYRLLDMARAYSSAKLAGTGERAAVVRQHALHMGTLMASAAADWDRLPQSDWLALYGARVNDVRAALAWSFGDQGDADLGCRITASSSPLWFALSLMDEYRQHAEKALAVRSSLSDAAPAEQMGQHEALGHAYWHTRGIVPAMEHHFANSLDFAERLGSASYELRSLWGLATYANNVGDYALSLALAQRFGRVAATLPEKTVAQTHDRMMTMALALLGDHAGARRLVERTLASLLSSGSTRVSTFQIDARVAAGTLARILAVQGERDAALATIRRCASDIVDSGHVLSICFLLSFSAVPVLLWCGQQEEAKLLNQRLRALADERSMVFWQAYGNAYQLAIDALEDGVQRPVGSLAGLVDPAGGAILAEAVATLHPALASDEVLARAERNQSGWAAPELLRVRGLSWQERGQALRARTYFEAAHALALAQGARTWLPRIEASLQALQSGPPAGPS